MDSASSAAAQQKDLQLALRSTNWQVSPKLERNIYANTDQLTIHLDWSQNRFAPNPEEIHIQYTQMPSLEKAIEYLQHILHNVRQIRRLDLKVDVSATEVLDAVLAVLAASDRVQLEELYVRRRYVGHKFPSLVGLIRSNASTLRIVGKIGLGEAIEAFNDQIHLERLSLINFDLVEPEQELDSEELALKSRFFIRRLAGLGATFNHLSYTCYGGFDITRMPALHMLRQCKVKSLRLTMQSGIAVQDPPLPRPLLPLLRHLQLVGNVEVHSDFISRLFPALEQFDFQRQDLITGSHLEKRARVLSQYVPEFAAEPNFNPIAAAC